MATIVQSVIWTEDASPRDQLVFLRLLDVYGFDEFDVTHQEICDAIKVSPALLAKTLVRLKKLGWIEWVRRYGPRSGHLQQVIGCRYRLIKPEAD
jgi:transcription initiation factor IIE alpha subunit